MRRTGIPDYDMKRVVAIRRQAGRCAVSGDILDPGSGRKIDLHHIYAKNEVNKKLYPLFVDSNWNLRAVYNDAHTTKTLPEKPPESEVVTAEAILNLFEGVDYEMTMSEALALYSEDV